MSRSAARREYERQVRLWKILWKDKQLWTPSAFNEATLGLWLDADDARTISLNAGNVSRWNDKSGNGRDVSQAVAANQPLYSIRSLNSRNVVAFDGNNDGLLNLSAALLQSVSGASVFAVSRRTANNATNATIINITGAAQAARIGLGYRESGGANQGFFAGGRRLDADSFQGVNNATFVAGYAINGAIFNYQAADLRIFEQGTETGQRVFQTSGVTSAGNGQLAIGVNVNGVSFPLNGDIAEIVLTQTAVSTEQRQRIEGYLAHKWFGRGLLNGLPFNHPFKNVPPTI